MASNTSSVAPQLLHLSQDEISRADAKAAAVLEAAGLLFGVVIAVLLAGDWSPGLLVAPSRWVWWTGAVTGLSGLFIVGSVLFPRVHSRNPRTTGSPYRYYGDVSAFRTAAELREAFEESEPGEDWIFGQLFEVAHIARAKNRSLRYGLLLLGGTMFLWTLSGVLHIAAGS